MVPIFPTDLDEISDENGNRLLLKYLKKFNNDHEYAALKRDKQLERLRLFNVFSLNVNCGLSVEVFGDMIKACGFMKKKSDLMRSYVEVLCTWGLMCSSHYMLT